LFSLSTGQDEERSGFVVGLEEIFLFFEEKGGMGIKTFCCKQEQARFAERVYFRE